MRRLRILTALAAFCLLAQVGTAVASPGHWDRAWGKNVDSTGGLGHAEICTVAAICQAGSTLSAEGGAVTGPAGVAVNAAGDVYVAENYNNRIEEFDSSGAFLRAWGKDVVAGGGTGAEVCTVAAACQIGAAGSLGGEFDHPTGVATDADGNVYVVESYISGRVQKFDGSGVFERAWGKDAVAGGGTGFEICTVAANCQGGSQGTLGGEFVHPFGVATDAASNVYVADVTNNRIQEFDAIGSFQRLWGRDVTIGGGTGAEICAIAVNCKAGTAGGLGGEMSAPQAVAVDPAGDIYVVESTNQRIQRFDPAANFQSAWGRDVVSGGGTGAETCTAAAGCKAGGTGGLAGELRGPDGIALDAAGNVYVADDNNARIQTFSATGGFKSAWGKDVNGGGVFGVCTVAPACLQGTAGTLGGELDQPDGIAVDAAGDVYVSAFGNNRIEKFTDPPASQPPPATLVSAPTASAGGSKCKRKKAPKRSSTAARKCKRRKHR